MEHIGEALGIPSETVKQKNLYEKGQVQYTHTVHDLNNVLSYPNPFGLRVIHKSEKSIPLKLSVLFNYSNRTVTTLIEQSFL